MMDRQSLMMMWDQMRQAHGIALRCVEALPADQIDRHPIPNMRTPKELVVHLYGSMVRAVVEGVARGEIVTFDEQKALAGIRTQADLLRFCRECWDAADRAVQGIGPAQLQAMVKTPWDGMQFPGFACFGITQNDFFHHRGQLYAHVRALGAEPPFMWDFEHNAPEFQPRAQG